MEYKKNDLVKVTISDIGSDGEGIGRVDGYTLFVKDAIPGDTVLAHIVKPKKNYAFARVKELVVPSKNRVKPECALASKCGGCQIQALDYKVQCQFKQQKVKNNLVRLGNFSEQEIDAIMDPIITMDDPFRYRNKAQYPIGQDKEGNPVAGFYAGRTHSIIPSTDCILGREENKTILEYILSFMKTYDILPYNEGDKKGLIRHVLIRTGFCSGQIMVCFVINGKTFPYSKQMVEGLRGLKDVGEQIKSICYSSNMANTNVIMGDSYQVIWGDGYITDSIGSIQFQISPLSFFQVNPIQTAKLYEQALTYANLTGKETVWDLYCGIGTISLFLARQAKQVYGVEIIPQAIENANENAAINHIENARFFVGKAEEVLPKLYEKENIHADVIVVDPPRKGCDQKCLETMIQMAPDRIVYVSCDSATLARDLKYLCEKGYALKKVRAVDQFPMTCHVETCALLTKTSGA